MTLHNFGDFFKLSAVLNYQLTAATDCTYNVIRLIVGDNELTTQQEEVLFDVITWLKHAYLESRRKLGPLAVLHPIRATALLAQSLDHFNLLDLLTELFHDKLEDIKPERFKKFNLGPDHFPNLELEFQALLKKINPKDDWYLNERISWLTRKPEGQSYYEYIGTLMTQAADTPELIRVKLADRLDNTLDLHIDLTDPLDELDFYGLIFQLLFVKHFTFPKPKHRHAQQTALNGAQRLYQLFKNAVLLSMIRQQQIQKCDPGDTTLFKTDPSARILFDAVALASLKEAQRVVLHIFSYHLSDVREQRQLIMDAMAYCHLGGTGSISEPSSKHILDGLFQSKFDHKSSEERTRKLESLYLDKPLMIEAGLAFVVIFRSFLNFSKYYIDGISSEGVHCQ